MAIRPYIVIFESDGKICYIGRDRFIHCRASQKIECGESYVVKIDEEFSVTVICQLATKEKAEETMGYVLTQKELHGSAPDYVGLTTFCEKCRGQFLINPLSDALQPTQSLSPMSHHTSSMSISPELNAENDDQINNSDFEHDDSPVLTVLQTPTTAQAGAFRRPNAVQHQIQPPTGPKQIPFVPGTYCNSLEYNRNQFTSPQSLYMPMPAPFNPLMQMQEQFVQLQTEVGFLRSVISNIGKQFNFTIGPDAMIIRTNLTDLTKTKAKKPQFHPVSKKNAELKGYDLHTTVQIGDCAVPEWKVKCALDASLLSLSVELVLHMYTRFEVAQIMSVGLRNAAPDKYIAIVAFGKLHDDGFEEVLCGIEVKQRIRGRLSATISANKK